MKMVQKALLAGVLWLSLMGLSNGVYAQTPAEQPSQDPIALLKEHNSKLSGDLRRIQREIAALRADLDKPGLKDIVSGIGYIFGLFGVAAFVAARRKE